MSDNTKLTRRRFLVASVASTAGLVIAACASPTPVPPASATKPAGAATAAPPPAATVAAAPKTAATAPVAAKPEEGKIGKQLIGKLEGPEIILDPARIPKTYKEAPMLAELVKAGKLPPVEKRVPEEPLVLKPVREIGKFGGNLRRGFTGPADGENGNRLISPEKFLFVDYTGTKTMPSVAKAWKGSDDGKSLTLTLRKGMKWSDGNPFTANDVMFWYQDMYSVKDLVAVPTAELSINGKPGTLEKVDDLNVTFKFPEPYYLFEEIVRGDSTIGGHARQGDLCMGGYAPAHYLKQFHPKYTAKEEVDQKAKDAKFDNWVNMFKFKNNWRLNVELPVLTAWKTVNPINTPSWVLERNPYYWEVDTEGNQLPYIDKITMLLGENTEVVNLRAVAGEYDFQERHLEIPKLPLLVENQQRGNYKVYLDPAEYGSDAVLLVNLSFDGDPEVAKWLGNRDFRRALSLGIERDQFNEVFWLGTGTPGSPVVTESHPYNPGPEYRKLWAVYDVKKANEMLDKVGLDKKDGEGFRLRTDGKGRLRIQLATRAAMFMDFVGMCEMVREQWKKIGIDAEVQGLERTLYDTRTRANELQTALTMNTGSEVLWSYPLNILPVAPDSINGPLISKWYNSGGQQGKKPEDPQLLKALEIFRSAGGLKAADRVKAAQEIWKIVIDEVWGIGIVGQGPAFMGVRVAKNNMGNIPGRLSLVRDARIPGGAHPATFFFKS